MSVKPCIQAMWLADEVTCDEATGKVTVRGLFNQIYAAPPAKVFDAPAYLFFGLTGVHGEVRLRLCYADLSTNRILIERPVVVSHTDPLALTDVVIRLSRMPIPHSGVYAWELYFDGELLGISRVNAFADS